jgi:hypothetical protein
VSPDTLLAGITDASFENANIDAGLVHLENLG